MRAAGRALIALLERCNVYDTQKEFVRGAAGYEHRLQKYVSRGFSVIYPEKVKKIITTLVELVRVFDAFVAVYTYVYARHICASKHAHASFSQGARGEEIFFYPVCSYEFPD